MSGDGSGGDPLTKQRRPPSIAIGSNAPQQMLRRAVQHARVWPLAISKAAYMASCEEGLSTGNVLAEVCRFAPQICRWALLRPIQGVSMQAQAEAPNRCLYHRPSAYAARGGTAAGVLGVSVSWQLDSKPPAGMNEHKSLYCCSVEAGCG